MDYFVQQLINGITLGSIYGLIAIGYTMVYGIIGMVNFAHGDVFMVSAFIALIAFLILTTWLGITSIALALFIVLLVSMLFTALVNWTIERVAYRPLRGSFRLAPLISAIGMSIFLSNFVQVAQGPRNKSIPPMVRGDFTLLNGNGFSVALSYKQLIIWGVTAALLVVFWYVVAKTPLGRNMRACEQDQKMAALGRRRRQSHHFDDLCHRGGAGRHRRHHVPDELRRARVFPTASCRASKPSPPPCSAASARCRARWSAGFWSA